MRGAIAQTEEGMCKPHENGEERERVQVELGHNYDGCVESAAAGRAGIAVTKQVVEPQLDPNPTAPDDVNARGKAVGLGGQEPPEPSVVALTDACSYEVAVMIERGDASLAGVAVLGSQWSLGWSIGRQTVLAFWSIRIGPDLWLAVSMGTSERSG